MTSIFKIFLKHPNKRKEAVVVKVDMFHDTNVSIYFSPQQSKDSDRFLRSFLHSQLRTFSLIFSPRIWYVLEIWSG